MDTWIDPKFLPLQNLILLAVLILTFRRLPAVMAMQKMIPVLQNTNEVRKTSQIQFSITHGQLYRPFSLVILERSLSVF